MSRYSVWDIYFRSQDESSIKEEMEQINKLIEDEDSELEGIPQGNIFEIIVKNDKEAYVSYEDSSYSSQDHAEHTLEFLSERFPNLIFHCVANIEDTPTFYINAQAGKLDWNYGEVEYSGFETIFYDDSDKPKPVKYTADEIKLAISDMTKLTDLLSGKIEPDSTPTTKVAEWALREILKSYYQEEVE